MIVDSFFHEALLALLVILLIWILLFMPDVTELAMVVAVVRVVAVLILLRLYLAPLLLRWRGEYAPDDDVNGELGNLIGLRFPLNKTPMGVLAATSSCFK